MKSYIKIIGLTFAAVLLTTFIFFVDTTFYHVPSFIKIYRFERELVIVIVFLLLQPLLKLIGLRFKQNVKHNLFFAVFVLVGLFLFVLIPQIICRKYLVLWDNNPLLAEYPVIWNLVSAFCTFCFIGGLILALGLIQNLNISQSDKYITWMFRILVSLVLVFAFVLNFFEDRYSYERVAIFQKDPPPSLLLLGGLILILAFYISHKKSWLDLLNRKEKYVGFGFSVMLLVIGIYLLTSRLLLPVLAFSTTVKGFALAVTCIIDIYLGMTFLGLLARLPTASLYDRYKQEILFTAKIGQMISAGNELQSVFDSIVQCSCLLTQSDTCWLEFRNKNMPEKMVIAAAVNLSEIEQQLLEESAGNTLTEWVIENKQPVLIDNLYSDARTLHLKLHQVRWKSLIAVPLIRENRVLGILYSAKKGVRVLNEKDLNTLISFGVQTNVALGKYDPADQNMRIESSIEKQRWIRSEVSENLELSFVLPQPDSPAPFVTKIELVERRVCYLVDYAAERGAETKGILKTLFTLESDISKVYNKACAILHDLHRKSGFDLIYLDRDSGHFTMTTDYPFIVFHFDSLKAETLEYNSKILQSDPPGQIGYYQFEKIGRAGDFIFSCPDKTIINLDLSAIFRQDFNQPATEELAGKSLNQILLQISDKVRSENKNPDLTPGIFMLVKLVGKTTAYF